MPEKPLKIAGPDHPIAVTANDARIVILLNGRTIADSRNVLTLREASYPPVHYIPRSDVDMAALERSDHATYCPYKGDASYFSVPAGGERFTNAIWSYEAPYDAVAGIKDRLAFYADRFEIVEHSA
jgi:uncharacterized protein (DUF427 family)